MAIEWWFGLPEGEQIRLSSTPVGGPWELYKLAADVETGAVAADAGVVSQLLQILGAEDSLLVTTRASTLSWDLSPPVPAR